LKKSKELRNTAIIIRTRRSAMLKLRSVLALALLVVAMLLGWGTNGVRGGEIDMVNGKCPSTSYASGVPGKCTFD